MIIYFLQCYCRREKCHLEVRWASKWQPPKLSVTVTPVGKENMLQNKPTFQTFFAFNKTAFSKLPPRQTFKSVNFNNNTTMSFEKAFTDSVF